MASKDHKVPLNSIKKIKSQLDISSKTLSPSPVSTKEKIVEPHFSRRTTKESKALPKLTTKNTCPTTTNKVQQISQLPLKKEVPNIIRKKTVPVRVTPTTRKRTQNTTLSTKDIPKTKREPHSTYEALVPQSSLDSSIRPKLLSLLDNVTSFVKIDHEKIYPLLNIFIDYVHKSLPDRIKRKSITSEDFESLSEEFQEKVERFERQKLMDPLISPEVNLENIDNKDYENNFMVQKLNSLLPILRKCNGNINFVDENDQTILHIFMKKYVVVHKILQEEDIDKPEYENSPQAYLRKATFYVIEELLRKGSSVDTIDAQGNTPLHIIAKYEGYEEITKILLGHFKEIDSCDRNGDTVLHLLLGKEEMNEKRLRNVEILVIKGADMHKWNHFGMAPIHVAFERCQVETFSAFEKKEADFHLKTKDKKTSLHLVCKSSIRNDNRKIKTIDVLVKNGIDVNAVDNEGYAALHYAAKFSSRPIIEQLIRSGANVYCQTKEMNFTPLHLASQFGCASAINTLVMAGVDVNIVASGGIIPLHLALLHSDPLTVECLIVNGADVYRRDAIFGFTPIHMTAFACRKKLDLLVKKGVNVNARNEIGITPLHLASMLGNVEVIEALCEHDADVNCRDKLFGMTALHWASMKGKRLNLSRIVDGTNQYDDGTTVSEFWKPLFMRSCQKCDNHDNMDTDVRGIFATNNSVSTVLLQPKSEAMKILLKFGAHADVQDDEGRVVVHNVVKSDNVEGMKYLIDSGLDFNDSDTSRRISETWNSVKVRSYVLWNAMKLRIAGLPIAEVYVSKVVKPQFQCYHGYWEEEVKKLKRCLVDDGVSLHDVLCMKNRKKFDYVERVMKLRRDMEMNFPDYCRLVEASCRQAVVRMDLEEMAKTKLSRLAGVRLEDACCERVFEDLSNVDLRAFVEGVELELHEIEEKNLC